MGEGLSTFGKVRYDSHSAILSVHDELGGLPKLQPETHYTRKYLIITGSCQPRAFDC